MHIYIKNKKLLIKGYNVKCAIGKRGIGNKKKEGDQITPKGKYKIKLILFRNDRISNFKSNILKLSIKKDMGWCDDPRSTKYNKLIKFPFDYSAETLHRADNIYDIILVLDFNCKPTRKNRGSAIFIHIAKKNYKSTEGCVAISKPYMKKLINYINKETIVHIN
jgi:L,D-peptidoglycan transpeptidase YkuD (ErfK/YbiS/YcfS/YnhG family)